MGILTGTERWNGGGDTPFEDRRSGMPLSSTLGAEAERLARVGRKADLSCSDKNGQRPREMISSTGATPLNGLRIDGPRCRERNRRWRKSHQKKT